MRYHIWACCYLGILFYYAIRVSNQSSCSVPRRFLIKTDNLSRGLYNIDPSPIKTLARTNHIVECLSSCLKEQYCNAYTFFFNTTKCVLSVWPSVFTIVPHCFSYVDTSIGTCPSRLNGKLHYSCVSIAPGGVPGCYWNHTWMNCSQPLDYVAVNETVELAIPTFASTVVISVNNWIVFQYRVLGSTSYNGPTVTFARTWAEYKAGFGNSTGSGSGSGFWLGLEKMYQLMRSGHYMLRVEVCMYGLWQSVEHDTFVLGSEAEQYQMNVLGNHGDLSDIFMNQHFGYFYANDRDNSNSLAFTQQGGLWSPPNLPTGTGVTNLNGQATIGGTLHFLGPVLGQWGCFMARMMLKRID